MSPPDSTAQNGITGTRTKAETNRVLVGTIKRLARAAGFEPEPWQVRSLIGSLRANRELPSDEQVMRSLMTAPWFPKPHVRKYQIGEAGWRVRS